MRLSFTPLLPCRQASRTRQRLSLQACLQLDCGAHGGVRPCSSRSAPCARALQGEGDLRGCIVATGSLRQEEVPALFPSAASSFLPRGRGEPGRSPACMHPGPGWSFPGVSRVSSSYQHCPGLTAHQPSWRVWERIVPQSHGCPERGNAARLGSLRRALRRSVLWLRLVSQVGNNQLGNVPPPK